MIVVLNDSCFEFMHRNLFQTNERLLIPVQGPPENRRTPQDDTRTPLNDHRRSCGVLWSFRGVLWKP